VTDRLRPGLGPVRLATPTIPNALPPTLITDRSLADAERARDLAVRLPLLGQNVHGHDRLRTQLGGHGAALPGGGSLDRQGAVLRHPCPY
jgi:hypothetical protein